MNFKNIFNRPQLQCLLGISLLVLVTGCRPTTPPVTARAAAEAPPVVVAQPEVVANGLVYYPDYEVYYDPTTHVYWHNDGSHWNSGPAPSGVTVTVLQSSPSAPMSFWDSPENHHSEVVRQYPHGWKPTNAHSPGGDSRGN